jgi:hypothetical protein
MRWQRSADAAQGRWCDLTTSPDRFLELDSIVVPVVLLGTDAPDQERGTFQAYGEINPPAGQVVIGTLDAAVGDVEVVDAWASAVGGNFEIGWGIVAGTPGGLPSNVFGSCPGQSHARVSAVTAGGGLGFGPGARENTNRTLHVPGVQGMRLSRGRMLYVQHTNLAQTGLIGFAWRNIGSPSETQ